MPTSATAWVLWALNRATGRPVVWVTAGPLAMDAAHRDALALAPYTEPPLLFFPQRDLRPAHGQAASADHDFEATGHRLETLLQLDAARDRPFVSTDAEAGPPVLVTCVQALMQSTPTPAGLQHRTLTLCQGQDAELEEVSRFLQNIGYAFEHEVSLQGTATVRGGLLDVWPATEPWPARIEFTGATIESIRAFDPANQRSMARLSSFRIPAPFEFPATPGKETRPTPAAEPAPAAHTDLFSFLPRCSFLVWSNRAAIDEHADVYEQTSAESDNADSVISLTTLNDRAVDQELHQLWIGPGAPESPAGFVDMDLHSVHGVFDLPQPLLHPDIMEETRGRLLADLRDRANRGQTVCLFMDTPGARDHFDARLRADAGPIPGLTTEVGILSSGFVSESMGLAVVAESDLYGSRKEGLSRYDPKPGRARRASTIGSRIAELTDMEPGDLVVHVDHGIGRYRGLREITVSDQPQEVLTIEYADKAKLHVPVTHTHLLSRYVGSSRRAVTLHKLGGKRWDREKTAAEDAIQDLAAVLLETQAERDRLNGFAFRDTPWQREFEASFPYRETTDQREIIRTVQEDMSSSRPMDRLICGDAGYGKTEVAMRAAFRAVMNDKQVAVLVPTTVLAQQHYETFTDRMSVYPVRIDMLSRFTAGGRRPGIVQGMADGKVDIVIGTHALLQPNIRFKDLGLVIVDEEQRFGVTHKEQLKQMRTLVDVLTLTATPIPRTLYMSLTGARDMSLLQTPPLERVPIQTIVTKNTDEVVREAILRELSREGQVFYLHNRVMTIENARKRIEQLVPDARVAIGHGQMAATELAAVMHRFAAGEIDILVCTTIVESGVDIPRANTILIDRADRFGIADLYQLRGRVGRSCHRAYAHLLLPAHGHVDADARKRIGAVSRYSSLSAGFSLALRDLEIRGSGNLLGAEQSGYIAAVGFALYCQLLRRTVARQKGEPLPPLIEAEVRLDFLTLSPQAAEQDNAALIPYAYIEDERLRVAVYRKLAETTSREDVEALAAELQDRFGPVPTPMTRLLQVAMLRVVAAERDIQQVETRGDRVLLTRNNDCLMRGTRLPRLSSTTPDARIAELLELVEAADELN